MIGVIGDSNVGLKTVLSRLDGFDFIGSIPPNQIVAAVNCSYNTEKMRRLGQRFPYLREGSEVKVFNRTLRINKLDQICIYEENGINVPEWIIDDEWDEYLDGTWLIKPTHSQRGVGIRTLENNTVPSSNRAYVQKKINKVREFRAHIALFLPEGEQCFSIQEKKPKPEVHGESLDRENLPLCWNVDNGFYYRRSTTPENRADKCRRFPLFRRIEDIGIKAVKSLGYDFSAVDIIMDNNRTLNVLETNSHASLKNEASKEVYREIFSKLPSTLSPSAIGRTRTVSIRRR